MASRELKISAKFHANRNNVRMVILSRPDGAGLLARNICTKRGFWACGRGGGNECALRGGLAGMSALIFAPAAPAATRSPVHGPERKASRQQAAERGHVRVCAVAVQALCACGGGVSAKRRQIAACNSASVQFIVDPSQSFNSSFRFSVSGPPLMVPTFRAFLQGQR